MLALYGYTNKSVNSGLLNQQISQINITHHGGQQLELLFKIKNIFEISMLTRPRAARSRITVTRAPGIKFGQSRFHAKAVPAIKAQSRATVQARLNQGPKCRLAFLGPFLPRPQVASRVARQQTTDFKRKFFLVSQCLDNCEQYPRCPTVNASLATHTAARSGARSQGLSRRAQCHSNPDRTPKNTAHNITEIFHCSIEIV